MINEQIKSLKSADEYLDNLEKGISDVINFIDKEEYKKVYELMPLIADGLEWIIKVVTLTEEVQKEKIDISDINEYLYSIVEAMEDEDFILISDLFNYEILPILESVHNQIKKNLE